MSYLASLSTTLVPLGILLFPGIALVRWPASAAAVLLTASQVVLWSLTLNTLVAFTLAFLGLPVVGTAYIAGALVILRLLRRKKKAQKLSTIWCISLTAMFFVIAYAAFSIPYLLNQDGLPTGDVQKSILWAQQILRQQHLPNYEQAKALLNRDPVDFYTPGLHALTALVMRLTPAAPLVTVGLLSISISVAGALVATALALRVLPAAAWPASLLVPVLVLTNIRYLRYLREPGYHFQNVVGELLLFGLLLLALRLVQKWHLRDALLATLMIIALAISHQFSGFIAVFLLLPLAVVLLYRYRRRHVVPILVTLIGLTALAGVSLGLHHKIPHLFTTSPHLLDLLPALADYPRLMGASWFFAGLAGLLLITWRKNNLEFTFSVFVLLILSQGPRLGIDIPPVRALFYTVIPLSITAAYFIFFVVARVRRIAHFKVRALALAAVIITIAAATISPVVRAYQGVSPSVRTNSTLSAEQLWLIDYLRAHPSQHVLIDDYNRRSASWLVLSGQGMFTRLAADLERQMEESIQSASRRELYVKQLDFEKIFSLGSRPEITELMTKHNIGWLTGITGSSDSSFQYNPALREVARGGDTVVYAIAGDAAGGPPTAGATAPPGGGVPRQDPRGDWLLLPTTLANDIGDREDTFEHLPASLRATRLSDPQYENGVTHRTTTAPYIPLAFNVGQFVRVLWEKDAAGQPMTALELRLELREAPAELSVITPTGISYALTATNSTIKIPAHEVPFDDDGFITLSLYNPQQQEVKIDLIALGLAL